VNELEGLKEFLDQRGATQGMPNMQNIEKEIFEDEDVKACLRYWSFEWKEMLERTTRK